MLFWCKNEDKKKDIMIIEWKNDKKVLGFHVELKRLKNKWKWAE